MSPSTCNRCVAQKLVPDRCISLCKQGPALFVFFDTLELLLAQEATACDVCSKHLCFVTDLLFPFHHALRDRNVANLIFIVRPCAPSTGL